MAMKDGSASEHAAALPKGWPGHVKAAVVQAVALAHAALVTTRAWAADSSLVRLRLAARNERLESEVALLRRELDLLRARLGRVAAKNRPHYLPAERLQILELKAARCWSAAQLARRLLLSGATIAEWSHRLDESGAPALLATAEPVSRFPELVTHVVQSLRATLPTMGKKRIAQLLARAGVHLSVATVARLLKRRVLMPPPRKSDEPKRKADAANRGRTVTAKYPHHVWNLDFTSVPTALGYWVPWLPFAMPLVWPFSWQLALVLDHFSRKLLAFELFRKEATTEQLCALLTATAERLGTKPKYTVSDQGSQFGERYRAWCETNGVTPRFGAIGKHGSIAVTERCIRSLKEEGLRRILVPLHGDVMRRELEAYVEWFNHHRPHQGLGARTPSEVHDAKRPARDGPHFETRARFPLRGALARGVPRKLRGKRGVKLRLVVARVEGREHLPIVSLQRSA